jgi:cell division initiation protein
MTDLDLPLLPSAEQIRRREFATIRRGYDPDQVRDYLHQVAAQVETLEREVRDAKLGRAKIDQVTGTTAEPAASFATASSEGTARGSDDAYDALAKRFSTLIATADKEAQKILGDAKAEATRLMDQARSEADRIRVDAQARAEEARQQGSEALVRAREEADRLLSSLSQRRDSLVDQMHQMRTRLLAVAHELEAEMGDADGTQTVEPGPSAATFASAPSPTASGTAAPNPTSRDDAPVDPRYEDLWVSSSPSESVDIPDLASIDLDVDDEGRSRD